MKTRFFLGALTLFLCAFSFISCSNDDEEEERKITNYKELVLTVASKKVPGVLDGNKYVSEVYAVKNEQEDEWIAYYGNITGFEHEKGYEYKIKVSETTYLDYAMGDPSWTERELLEVISKDKKESEDLPLHLVPENYYKGIPLPQYQYAVKAENKSLIEEDLEANSILPKEYHYMLCQSHEVFKWIGIQDDNNKLVSYIVKTKSKNPLEMPESYKLLPPDGHMTGGGEWTFLNESGNTANYPPFDVFIGYFSKTRSVQPAYNMLCFYKDLTQHYQNKYPEAGVKTVVISYTFIGFF